ncbi:Pyridine nucleotide-disulphide oxidoreductase [Actinopolyspora alba]|uniref:Pyridine nucleotide-disulphide oxidoreductase n=1 Tax=Actinopolyspora alba TaxID=673379 RepID=A0A1I1TCP0_9ACTN|nr:NAD(P)-binding domain-containing protein [Actinopolyspora alba]SFD56372.1 Pyridine nucleotide-disulphide oxidoreductase [Actinopolyspora alba]
MSGTPRHEVIVIGGGQAGLAAGYFLRRAGVDFVILGERQQVGWAWQHMWPSLRLFSPAPHNSLPGWPMPPQPGAEFPTVDHAVEYPLEHERRYELPVRRPVRVDGVRRARERGVLHALPMFDGLTRRGAAWADGTEREFDDVVWCTGFRPALRQPRPLGPRGRHGRIPTEGTRSLEQPRLHLLGYGEWTGAASATLIGVGRTARSAVAELTAELDGSPEQRSTVTGRSG